MSTAGEEVQQLPCREFSEFKEALQLLRADDDKIIYKLNTSLPTTSFSEQGSATEHCKDLYQQLQSLYKSRSSAIQKCVDETTNQVAMFREQRDNERDSNVILKQLRKEQTKLRLMKSELGVEEVVKERSMKVFRERCWKSYKPPDF
ncbi:protein MIX23-like [Halichondria panicea]|uniref:protein MIX23-like n=1 Tax=Halichondria panicea TaxID=6063 RepID=UPI00312B36D5